MPNTSSIALAVLLTHSIACVSTRTSTSIGTSPPTVARRGHHDAPPLDEAVVLDRQTLICAVLDSNRDLAAAQESIHAARAAALRPVAAESTRVELAIAPASIGRAVPFGYVVELEQSFRLGQGRLERELATTNARSEAERRDAVRNELALATATLFDDHFEVARALETNAEHHALMIELVDAAKRRYAAGLASAQDPLQAELELVRIEQERIAIEAEGQVVTARANRLLHRRADAPLPAAPDRLPEIDALDDSNELHDEALATRPDVRVAEHDAEARARGVDLARRRFAPGLSAMASYNSMWADPQHRFMIGVGLMLPLQIPALRAGVEQARAEERRARRVAESQRDRVTAEVQEARARLSAADRIARLHRDRLVPTARERVEAARIGYETNANDLDTLIDAERELRSAQLDAQRAIADVDRRRAQLRWAIGRKPCEAKAGAR